MLPSGTSWNGLTSSRFRRWRARASLFATVDEPALRPLPVIPYEFASWRKARVVPDYHIEVEKTFYSVPYTLVREYVDVRITEGWWRCFYVGNVLQVMPVNKRIGTNMSQIQLTCQHLTESSRSGRQISLSTGGETLAPIRRRWPNKF